ncbi:MAG: hypothetical protein U9N76_04235 [Candidatus Marinimicrobia bacterium]|nr:hypothetical protein [Candidatus Neomarinimicrobiota bacterium]
MISKMSKLTLLVMKSDIDNTINKLRKLGVVHINEIKKPISTDIDKINNEIENTENTIKLISNFDIQKQKSDHNPEEIINDIVKLEKEKVDLETRITELNEIVKWYENWGDISLQDINDIKKSGYKLNLFSEPISYLKANNIDEIKNIFVISKDKNNIKLVEILTKDEDGLNLKEIQIPEIEYSEVKNKVSKIQKQLKNILMTEEKYSAYLDDIKNYKSELENKLEFAEVKYGMGDSENVFYLSGYCPESKKDKVVLEADKNSWGYIFEKPTSEDNPPVLLKNSKWIRIIQPIFDFMGTTPGYHEYDISIWFLLFFSMFFGMLIGDAGYGMIFLIGTFLARRKLKKAPFEPFALFYVLSGATIIWGVLSGTYFGSEAIAQLSILKMLVNPNISSFDLTSAGFNNNQNFMISLCFLIGAVHLTIAHSLIVFRDFKSLKMLSQIGWIGIVWSLYFVAGNLVLQKEFPQFVLYLLSISMLFALLFSNAENGILKGIGVTLRSLPLDIISGFSDVVSYLRLFAVGYASVVVAYSFNQMAIGSGINSIASGIIAVIILLLGHTLNILLGAMGVIVHGVRLNMLEFSGHLNMEWSGINYKPFK